MRNPKTPESMSANASQLWEQIQKLTPEEQGELRDRMIRESLPDYGEISDEELVGASRQIAQMLDEEENARAR